LRKEEWCPRPESNRHALRRGILSPLRLPIPPLGQVRVAESNSWREVGNYTQVFPPLGGLKNHLLPPYTPDTRRVWHVATRPPRYVQSFIHGPNMSQSDTPVTPETLGFQAEVKQLLHLMIHSLYSNREIFLRELVSNASDACDKLRFEAIDRPELYEGDAELRIRVDYDKEKHTITVSDNGIGMTRDEAVNNLGTIARSGTKEFFSQLTGDKQKDAQLIGQFGV